MKTQMWYLLDQVEYWANNHPDTPLTANTLKMLIEEAMKDEERDAEEINNIQENF